MAIQAPEKHLPARDEVDAGVIEDARRRQRFHRRVGGSLLMAAILAGVLAVSFSGGGGAGGVRGLRFSGSGGGSVSGTSKSPFAGAPTTQRDGYGVLDRACPLAAPNRYLPARAGCVEAIRADLGGGQRDLAIIYSILSSRHPYWFAGQVPPEIAKDFVPERPYLEIVLPDGRSVSTQVRGPRGTWAAAVDFLSKAPAGEIFLEVTRGSGGGADVVYGFRDGRLVRAGPALQFGGDSAYRAGFACVQKPSPGVVQRTFDLIGPSIYGVWKETEITYSWERSRLVQTSRRTVREHGQPARSESELGAGCGKPVKES